MQTHRLKIIQATYKQRQHDTLVELYGRTDTGQSITVLYEGFYPYCYMEAVPGALEVVRRNGAVAPKVLWDRLEDVELIHDQKTIKCHKITVMHPSVVKKIRDQFNAVNVLLSSGINLDRLPQFFSADIKFGIRFMYDLDLGSCVEVMGKPYEEEHPYITELVILADIVAPAEDFQVNFSILSYDIEASMSTKTMLCNCLWIRRSDGTEVEYRMIGTEKEMLKEFQKIIIEEDPDVITGYNIDGFDNPYLNDRHEANYLPRLKIGRNSTAWKSRDMKQSKMWFATGRIIADAMYMARKFKNPRRETLQYVSQLLLGESKLDVNASLIDEEWAKSRQDVLDYCSKDAYLALRIIDKLKVLDYFSNLAAVGMVPLTTVYSGATTPLIDSHVIREFEKAGFAVPVGGKRDPNYQQFEGATVVDPEPGVHNWVVVVDYKCFSEDTELLTAKGWKTVSEVSEGETIATLNIESEEIEYQNVGETHTYAYEGDLCHIRAGGVDQLVTPNHRTVFKKRDRRKCRLEGGLHWEESFCVEEVANLPDFISIPHFGKWKQRRGDKFYIVDLSVDMDSFLYWLGWFISEGSISERSVHITQSKPENISKVRAAFDGLGLDYKENVYYRHNVQSYGVEYELNHKDIHRFSIHNKKFRDDMIDLLGGEEKRLSRNRRLPRWTLDRISAQQCDILLESLTLGDGTKTDSDWCYWTASPGLADDVQELALKAGYSALVFKYVQKHSGKEYPSLGVSIARQRRNVIRKNHGHVNLIPYSGNVYCVSVPNGTVVCRRNGRASISGNSLYPTTIMVHNMCPTTLDMENGTIVSPVGAKFLPPEVRKGLIPIVIERLLDMRSAYKKKMWVEDPDNPGEFIKSPMYGFYNGLQNAVKVISNAMYGVLGAVFYRFFKKIIASSITGYSRAALDRIIQWIRKMELPLIAGDTDSCFVRSPWPNLNGCITLGKMLSNRFTADGYELEFEKVLNPWFTHGAKKRYFSYVVWDDGKILEEPEVYSRGYEIRRTDSFDYCLDSLEELLQAVCTEGAETAVSLAKERVKMIYEGSVSAEQIAYSKRCKPEAEYKKPESQIQVRMARMLKEMGHRFTPWMKVSFIYTDGDKSPKQAYPFIDGEKFPHTPDWDYYAVRMAEVLGRVTDVFGCDAGALLQYAKGQTSLDSYGVVA